ncbi:DEAD/DEAH box helicase [Burkholderia sp. AU31280]|nr:DEAD/DEAH box helicase [Burkholderia sp. AU31280]
MTELINGISRLLDEDLKQAVRPGGRLKIRASCFESPRNSLKVRGLKK